MRVVQVDGRAEAAQRALDAVQDVLPIPADLARRLARALVEDVAELAREEDALAQLWPLREHLAHETLAPPAAVDVRAIEIRLAGLDGRDDQRLGLLVRGRAVLAGERDAARSVGIRTMPEIDMRPSAGQTTDCPHTVRVDDIVTLFRGARTLESATRIARPPSPRHVRHASCCSPEARQQRASLSRTLLDDGPLLKRVDGPGRGSPSRSHVPLCSPVPLASLCPRACLHLRAALRAPKFIDNHARLERSGCAGAAERAEPATHRPRGCQAVLCVRPLVHGLTRRRHLGEPAQPGALDLARDRPLTTAQTESGQAGYNRAHRRSCPADLAVCGKDGSPTAKCQTLLVNSLNDCALARPEVKLTSSFASGAARSPSRSWARPSPMSSATA